MSQPPASSQPADGPSAGRVEAVRRASVRSRGFIFVKNNPTDDDIGTIRAYIESKPDGYWTCALVVRHRHGNETPHIHVLLHRPNAIRLSSILRACVPLTNAHSEILRDPSRHWQYMLDPEKVEEVVVRIGEPGPGQGHRTDHDVVYEQIAEGASVRDILRHNPGYFMKYHAGVCKAVSMESKPREVDRITVYILYGDSGTGKTVHARRLCEELAPADGAHWVSYSEGRGVFWWDGYDRQKVVVLDEYRGQIPLLMINRLVDFGGFRGQVKGGTINVVADTFIFTTNYLPGQWHRATRQKRATLLAFMRRLKEFSTCIQFLRPSDGVRRGPDGLPTFVPQEDYIELNGDQAAAEGWFDCADEDQQPVFNFNRNS